MTPTELPANFTLNESMEYITGACGDLDAAKWLLSVVEADKLAPPASWELVDAILRGFHSELGSDQAKARASRASVDAGGCPSPQEPSESHYLGGLRAIEGLCIGIGELIEAETAFSWGEVQRMIAGCIRISTAVLAALQLQAAVLAEVPLESEPIKPKLSVKVPAKDEDGNWIS